MQLSVTHGTYNLLVTLTHKLAILTATTVCKYLLGSPLDSMYVDGFACKDLKISKESI